MKNEDKTTTLGKLGYGLKYTAAIVFAILAICALCFIFISITTYFAPPLQPMFDQERLGQLGDFLGGTLNPIFGFITILLLFTSLMYQIQANSQQKKIFETDVKIRQIDEAVRKAIIIINRSPSEDFPKPIKYMSHYGSVAQDEHGNTAGWTAHYLKNIEDVVALYNNKYHPKGKENYSPACQAISDLLNDETVIERTEKMSNKEFLVRMVKQLNVLIEAMNELSAESKSNLSLRLLSIEVKDIVKKYKISGLICQEKYLSITKILDSF